MTSSQVEQRGRVRVEAGHKRVRAFLDGQLVADTIRPTLVWESPYYPTYYLPREDIRAELVSTGATRHSPSRGDADICDVQLGGSTAAGAALVYPGSPLPELRNLVRLEWGAMSEWLEEDEPVYGHPRDPYTRLDILPSSRHIQIRVDGVLVAESRRPTIVFETGLRPRYYLPMGDVRLDLLRPAETTTHCPYKGTASYWDIVLGDRVRAGLVWGYRTPLPESIRIAGLIAFYDEKVEVTLDGVTQAPAG